MTDISFRDARPSNLPPDVAVLANQMNLGRPVSLRKLIGYLSGETAVQFNSAGLPETSGIAANASWTLNAQGSWLFTGNLNNSNLITQQWAIGMKLPEQDLWVNATGQVGPNLPLFSNTASWNYAGFDQRIIDFWPEIFGTHSKSATAATNLQVSVNVGDALEVVGISLGVGVILALAALGPNGKGWQCDPPGILDDGNFGLHCYPRS